ncbi:hypothetical protein GOP47_0028146 [Adiantum capillus-veneris]|nr:hypothetical protein GOP47_0028146 [Adiantum capillus-veneris]
MGARSSSLMKENHRTHSSQVKGSPSNLLQLPKVERREVARSSTLPEARQYLVSFCDLLQVEGFQRLSTFCP